MPNVAPSQPITAIVYSDSTAAARLIERIAHALTSAGHACAGFIQRDEARPGRSRCDMVLVNLATGKEVGISEDRGPGARGCQLDAGALACAVADVEVDLDDDTAVLILNKFGKSEVEGGGFRELISTALARDIPVVLGVPRRNIESWRQFAGAFACEVNAEDVRDCGEGAWLDRLGFVTRASGATPHGPQQQTRG